MTSAANSSIGHPALKRCKHFQLKSYFYPLFRACVALIGAFAFQKNKLRLISCHLWELSLSSHRILLVVCLSPSREPATAVENSLQNVLYLCENNSLSSCTAESLEWSANIHLPHYNKQNTIQIAHSIIGVVSSCIRKGQSKKILFFNILFPSLGHLNSQRFIDGYTMLCF